MVAPLITPIEEPSFLVLSSDMDPAEIRERGVEVFGKIRPPPILLEPFKKFERLLVFKLLIRQPF
jgi:hypothetical protein